jgi:UDP-glucose 4-epimerase
MELCPGCCYHFVPFPEETKRIDIGDYFADYSRFRTHVGWEPQIGVREGLEQTVHYYEQHRHQYW